MPRRPCTRIVRPALVLLLVVGLRTADAGRVLPLPEVDSPAGGGSSELEPVVVRAEQRHRLVFSCVSPGLVTFADRPCGPLPVIRELKLPPPRPLSPVAATPAADRDAPPAVTRTARTGHRAAEAGEDPAREHATTCQRLTAVLDGIDARMRAGYSAREAGDLWDRWRDAKARLHAADC
jgi:hypothetical protein